ncbi:hypothetical protein Tco_0846206, partial [Tanacetum coccineum]
SSTSKPESSSTEDDSNDEEFSSSSRKLVTCIPVSMKKSFSDEVEDETYEEAEDEKYDSDDETWSSKTIGTTSEPVRHCIIGLANPRTWDMIVKKEFEVRKEDVKKQVNESKEQVNKGEEQDEGLGKLT